MTASKQTKTILVNHYINPPPLYKIFFYLLFLKKIETDFKNNYGEKTMTEMGGTITQKQYDRFIKNMNKNKTGTSWIYLNCTEPDEVIKTKLYRDEEDNLFWVMAKCFERMYLKVL